MSSSALLVFGKDKLYLRRESPGEEEEEEEEVERLILLLLLLLLLSWDVDVDDADVGGRRMSGDETTMNAEDSSLSEKSLLVRDLFELSLSVMVLILLLLVLLLLWM